MWNQNIFHSVHSEIKENGIYSDPNEGSVRFGLNLNGTTELE